MPPEQGTEVMWDLTNGPDSTGRVYLRYHDGTVQEYRLVESIQHIAPDTLGPVWGPLPNTRFPGEWTGELHWDFDFSMDPAMKDILGITGDHTPCTPPEPDEEPDAPPQELLDFLDEITGKEDGFL